MSDAARDRAWLSAHLYFPGRLYGPEADDVVSNVVAPFVEQAAVRAWVDGHFFVRYDDGGPHIRLRVRSSSEAHDDLVRSALVAHARAHWRDVEIVDGPLPTGRLTGPLRRLLRWVDYSPELERYGGADAMRIAEACFEASSRAAIAMLRKLPPGDRPARLGKGLLAMLVLVHTFVPERAAARAFVRMYCMSYLAPIAREEGAGDRWRETFDTAYANQAAPLARFVSDAWERLEDGEALGSELDAYRGELQTARDALGTLCVAGRVGQNGRIIATVEEACRRIAPSYVHMMSNRLGVAILEEAYIAHLIDRALASPVCERVGGDQA